jgi:hypothetical protein
MAARTRVFIGSSSEGLKVAEAVRLRLIKELGETARVDLWTHQFELSATYIESLENNATEADFAILVLTPDDVTTSRAKENFAPRDNVVFELGLFMGRLGRERCYLVHEESATGKNKLKLPSDLLGVKAATFRRQAGDDLETALGAKCALIANQIRSLGVRFKLASREAAALAATHAFCDRLTGAWWELVTEGSRQWLSFFTIETDNLHNSVQLKDGRHFETDGSLSASWKSITVRHSTEENKISYLWQGWYSGGGKASPQDRFHGYGEIEFQVPLQANEPITRGQGKFWDVDESHPDKTTVKVAELRRVDDPEVVAKMTGGNKQKAATLVKKTLRDW